MNKNISIEELYQLFIEAKQIITTDTRKIEKNSIFFALKGDNFNANTFANEAIKQGCCYAVVDDVSLPENAKLLLVNNVLETLQNLAKHHRKQLIIPIIGITGSNGKTTNKELIYAVLSKKFKTYATKGNLNNHIGVPLTLLNITKEHEIAIVEMGANHQGEIEMLSDICNPDYGIITNIGKAHLEGFGGEEGIKKGKSELFKHIKNNNGKLFINGDDEVLTELSGDIEKICYGEKNAFDVYGKLLKNSEFVELQWNTKNKNLENTTIIKTNLFGHYNFINVLCAICIGNYFKIDTTSINEAIKEYVPEMNRSQVKKTVNNTLILDAYNANPSSMLLAIKHFINQPYKNKYLILGDMFELGAYSETEHQLILNELIKYPNINCSLVGEHFYEFKNDYLGFSFYKNIIVAEEHFTNNRLLNNTILIKGSRGIKLEKLVEYL